MMVRRTYVLRHVMRWRAVVSVEEGLELFQPRIVLRLWRLANSTGREQKTGGASSKPPHGRPVVHTRKCDLETPESFLLWREALLLSLHTIHLRSLCY